MKDIEAVNGIKNKERCTIVIRFIKMKLRIKINYKVCGRVLYSRIKGSQYINNR